MTKAADHGQSEAHTRAAPADDAPSSALPGADPASLVEGSPDLDADDLLAVAAELTAAPRRARGRPAGAANRKNADVIAYLAALGHRDPWVTLSMIQTADTSRLAAMLGTPDLDEEGHVRHRNGKPVIIPADPLKVLALQKSAAEALLPYHHAKKPQQLDLLGDGKDHLPMMVIGEMNVTQVNQYGAAMSLGVPMDETLIDQGVIEGEAVRDSGQSHDDDASH